MNQTFSFVRFGRLLRTYLSEHRGQLLTNAALLTGVLIMAGLFVYRQYPQSVDELRIVEFFILGWAAWYVFTWQQTESLNQKEQAITYLMRPASNLEKIGLIWLVSGLLFVVFYGFLFAAVDAIAISLVNNREWSAADRQVIGTYRLEPFYQSDIFWQSPPFLWVLSMLLHPFALTFLLVFRRFSLPLVALLAFALIGMGFLFHSYLMGFLISDGYFRTKMPFEDVLAFSGPPNETGTQVRRIGLPRIGNQIGYVAGSTAVLLLYVAAYFRLKEKEV